MSDELLKSFSIIPANDKSTAAQKKASRKVSFASNSKPQDDEIPEVCTLANLNDSVIQLKKELRAKNVTLEATRVQDEYNEARLVKHKRYI